MLPDIFDGLFKFLGIVTIIAVVSFPLAIWKLIDIGIWLYYHISIH